MICKLCGVKKISHYGPGIRQRLGLYCYGSLHQLSEQLFEPADPAPNSAHPVTADRFARYEAALREIATIMPSAAGAIAENALKDDGVIL